MTQEDFDRYSGEKAEEDLYIEIDKMSLKNYNIIFAMVKNKWLSNMLDKYLYKRGFYILLTIIFSAIAIILFGWNKQIDILNPIDYNLFGTFGDFFGGILGTIFALVGTLLLIRTFKYQQKVTNENEKQLETQRLNDLFFELIKLYQTEVKELCGQISQVRSYNQNDDAPKSDKDTNKKVTVEKTEISYNDKDFFDYEKRVLQNGFRNRKSFHANSREALKYYMLFYIRNRAKIAAYFRTIYRIYDLIDSSKLDEEVKKNYLKIMRAQLTESELFFIRYNAMSYYGANFIKYINKYHILKHLPALEMLEFKEWWEPLNTVERMGLNIVFDDVKRLIYNAFSNDKDKRETVYANNTSKYSLNIAIKKQYDVCISLTIDTREKNYSAEFMAFEKMNYKKIQQLFDCIIKEIFIFSNFNMFNVEEELEAYSVPVIEKDKIVSINSGIRNVKGKPLCIAYKFK